MLDEFTDCTQTVEAAYILVQEHLLEGLSALKEECRTSVRQQEVQIHSDMDQILYSRQQLEEKVRGNVVVLLWADTQDGPHSSVINVNETGSEVQHHAARGLYKRPNKY